MSKEELYLDILNNISDGVYFVDTERRIQFWNKGAENITGYSSKEIVGKRCQETQLNHMDAEGTQLCNGNCPLFYTLEDGERRSANVFLRHKGGYRISVNVSIFPIIRKGEITGSVEVFSQNSSRVYESNIVGQLPDIALYDNLTELPNKRYIESYLGYMFKEYNKFGRLFALLFANVDDFTGFNNQYGHKVGDELLKNIAQSIKSNIRKNDLVGRWSGGEFVGIYSIEKPSDVLTIANRFRQLVFNTEVKGPGKEEYLNISVSIGITIVQEIDTSEKSIIQRANYLMYRSKQSGKNCVTTG